ncbi:Exosome complex component CSL4 [Phlyctochytrium planicorne]|nr:Exosome complex component CSL4 [Phlyctochytrium planicorne]
MKAQKCTPGERLGLVGGDHIYSSVVGIRKDGEPDSSEEQTKLLSVIRSKEIGAIPEVDSIVTCRVSRINPRMANLTILVVGRTPCKENFQGIIRVQDVRATEKDKVQIYKCFRPGDIVRAQVISLGDSRAYFLSTARNDLGVIFAQSAAGHTMIPISWEEMICPRTKASSQRKF